MDKTSVSPIPTKVHLIWIGTNPYPDYFRLFLESFYTYLPEFQIRVWENKDLTKKNFPKTWSYIQKAKRIHGKQMVDEEGNKMYRLEDEQPMTYSKWAQITDLMRLEIVFREGGYYFDTTFEILKPMYGMLSKQSSKFVGCNEVPRFKDYPSLSNSFFGATKGNPILKRLLSSSFLKTIDFQAFDVDNQSGPGYLRSGIYDSDDVKILPTLYMYPFIEPRDSFNDPPYRKSKPNQCHSEKQKTKFTKLKGNKGYISYPCQKYPKSYALKHWQLGKSWIQYLNYVVKED
jgi:hypothetical protein